MFGLILNNFKQFFFVESNYNIHFLPALDIWFFFLWVGLLHNKMSCLKSVMIKFGHFKCEEKMLLWSLNTILMVKKKQLPKYERNLAMIQIRILSVIGSYGKNFHLFDFREVLVDLFHFTFQQ